MYILIKKLLVDNTLLFCYLSMENFFLVKFKVSFQGQNKLQSVLGINVIKETRYLTFTNTYIMMLKLSMMLVSDRLVLYVYSSSHQLTS